MKMSFTARVYFTDGSTEDIDDVYQVRYAEGWFYFERLCAVPWKVLSHIVGNISLREPGGSNVATN